MLPSLLLLLFVLPLTFACQIQPPYNRISLVSLQAAASHHVWSRLRSLCQLRFVNDDFEDDQDDRLNASRPRDVLLTPHQLLAARRLLPPTLLKVLISDLSIYLSEKCIQSVQSAPTVYTSANPESNFYNRFQTLDELDRRWKSLALAYPKFVSLRTIGRSVEGRPIYLFRIGRPKRGPSHRKVLLLFGQHAREWASVSSATYIAEHLAKYPPAIDVQVLLVPLVNPDGYVYSHNVDRFWRKNRNPNSSCSGVDLNRNWGKDWGSTQLDLKRRRQKGSTSPCADNYYGRTPFSEPEVEAIRRNIDLHNVVAVLDVHAYAQLIIGAWAHTRNEPPNSWLVDNIGLRLRTAASLDGAEYSYGRGENNGLYLASGVASDWFFHRGIVASYTMELRPNKGALLGFELDHELIVPTANDALRVVNALISYAHENGTNSFQPNYQPANTIPRLNASEDSERVETFEPSFSSDNTTPQTTPVGLIVASSIGALVVVVAIIAAAFFFAKRKTNTENAQIENADESTRHEKLDE